MVLWSKRELKHKGVNFLLLFHAILPQAATLWQQLTLTSHSGDTPEHNVWNGLKASMFIYLCEVCVLMWGSITLLLVLVHWRVRPETYPLDEVEWPMLLFYPYLNCCVLLPSVNALNDRLWFKCTVKTCMCLFERGRQWNATEKFDVWWVPSAFSRLGFTQSVYQWENVDLLHHDWSVIMSVSRQVYNHQV